MRFFVGQAGLLPAICLCSIQARSSYPAQYSRRYVKLLGSGFATRLGLVSV